MINLGKVQNDISRKWRSVLIYMRDLTRLAGDDKGYDLLNTLDQQYPTADDLEAVNAIYQHNRDFDFDLLKVKVQIEELNKIEEDYKGII